CPGQRAEEFALDQRLGQRRAVDLDEGAAPTGTVVVNDAGELALSRARLPGEEYVHVERSEERCLPKHRGESRAAPDGALGVQHLAPAAGRVGLLPAAPREQALGERCQVAREELGVCAILLRERARLLTSLEIEYAEGGVAADRCTQHRLDPARPHAVAIPEARVEQSRRRSDRLRGRRGGGEADR